MRCSGSSRIETAGCTCGGQIVHEGAVIGQVFTGTVHLHCPMASGLASQDAAAGECSQCHRPFATAIYAVMMWHAWTYLSGTYAGVSGDVCNVVSLAALASTVSFLRQRLPQRTADYLGRVFFRSRKAGARARRS